MDIKETIETFVMRKAKRMITKRGDDDEYMKHIEELLSDHDISSNNDVFQVFKMGAVDAMIYDVGCALGSRKLMKHDTRKYFLRQLFPKQ